MVSFGFHLASNIIASWKKMHKIWNKIMKKSCLENKQNLAKCGMWKDSLQKYSVCWSVRIVYLNLIHEFVPPFLHGFIAMPGKLAIPGDGKCHTGTTPKFSLEEFLSVANWSPLWWMPMSNVIRWLVATVLPIFWNSKMMWTIPPAFCGYFS